MKVYNFLLFIILILNVLNPVVSLSCQYGRATCIASCVAQNCATGYCPNGPKGVCVCSRCGNGPLKPV